MCKPSTSGISERRKSFNSFSVSKQIKNSEKPNPPIKQKIKTSTVKFGSKNQNQRLYQTSSVFSQNLIKPQPKSKKQLKNKSETKRRIVSFSQNEHVETTCRICQSTEDTFTNQQVSPCGCSGSAQFVHINCLKKWRQIKFAKGEKVFQCELCLVKYKINLLGEEGAVLDNKIFKIEENLKEVTSSGSYLIMLMKDLRLNINRNQNVTANV